jgi:hypothetical protein
VSQSPPLRVVLRPKIHYEWTERALTFSATTSLAAGRLLGSVEDPRLSDPYPMDLGSAFRSIHQRPIRPGKSVDLVVVTTVRERAQFIDEGSVP